MQKPGRGPMMKTGRGIPEQLMGPQAAQDGIIDNIRSAVKKVGQRISTAHERGKNQYYKNWSAADSMGSMGSTSGGRGGTSRNYDPTNYVGGFVKGLVTGQPQMYKK